MLSTSKQSGFGVIAIIVAILVVVGLGYVGYRVFTAQSSNSNTGNNQTNNTQVQADTYLDIKELGVKIKLSDGIKDAVYAPYRNPSDDSQVYGISAQSLIDQDSGPNCAAASGALGIIIKTKTAPTYVGSSNPEPVDNKNIFKFGDAYYYYHRPQAEPCLTDTQTGTDLVMAKLEAFAQSFTTLQLDN